MKPSKRFWLTILVPLLLAWLASSALRMRARSPNADEDLAERRDTSLALTRAGIELAPGYIQYADPGSIVTFTNVLTNTGDGPDIFAAEVASSQGWPIALIGSTYLSGTLRLPLPLDAGVTATLRVSLTVPDGSATALGAVDETVITITSQMSPTLVVTTTDTTIVSLNSVTKTLFLPAVVKEEPVTAKLAVDFGDLMFYTDVLTYDLPLAKQMGADWIRVELPWFKIEKSPGQYEWALYDTAFARIQQVGLRPLPFIYGAPSWAAEKSCGPISDTQSFENFLDAALTRYGPLVDAWEFTNEPDGKEPYPWGPIIGCWGLQPAEYASQLGIFYHKVRSQDPSALVFMGGLAYDNWDIFERSFFSKTLQSGAGQFFDGVSLHYYPINPEFPTLTSKVREIQNIMSNNGVRGKRIWITETSMWVNGPGGLEDQLNFIVRNLSRGFCGGVDNIFWLPARQEPTDPLHRWLINSLHQPDNGYFTFQHFAAQVRGGYCVGPYANVPRNVEAYKFIAPGYSLYVLWSNTTPTTVSIPASTPVALIDRDGNTTRVITPRKSRVTFEVDTRAVFLEVPGARSDRRRAR